MKPILLGISLFVAAAAVQDAHAQASADGRFSGFTRFQQGDLVIPAGSTTSGSVLVVRGNLDVYGNVDGAATAILGDVIVHEGGRVRGGAVALIGHVRNEGGSILGVIKDVGATHNRSTVSFGGRPRTTLGSLLTGVLGGLASIPALIVIVIAMAITIIGIFFIPFGVAAFLIAVSGIAILGFLAVAQVAGIAIAGKREAETAAGQQLQFLYTGILAFSALWIIAAAFTWFPILGAILRMLAFSVTFVAVATGFGAVILSWWRSRPKKNAVAV